MSSSEIRHAMEKKAKQFDRVVAEWKAKTDGLQVVFFCRLLREPLVQF